jgi:hypothetical protein
LKLNRDKDYAELPLNPLNPLHISRFRGFIPCSGTSAATIGNPLTIDKIFNVYGGAEGQLTSAAIDSQFQQRR